jgi:RimJ/RimL family protein N-acetyltransferase
MSLDERIRDRLDAARALAIPIKELTEADCPLLLAHLVELGPEDRYLRFGNPLSNATIEHYVQGIDFRDSTVLGVFDDELRLVAAGHFARQRPSTAPGSNGQAESSVAEFGLSVSGQARGRGIGTALFVRAAIHARNLGISTLFMHCLTQNRAMMRIARKAGMEISYAAGEADAYVALAPADAASVMREAMQEQIALFDFAFKQQLLNSRTLLGKTSAAEEALVGG